MRPSTRHRRRSLRLKGFDYSSPGNYFVTICTQDYEQLFGEIVDRQMFVNRAGEAVRAAWFQLSARFPSVVPDVFVVMPNHFHGIVTFTQPIPRAALGYASDGLPGNFTSRNRIKGAASSAPTAPDTEKGARSRSGTIRDAERGTARSAGKNHDTEKGAASSARATENQGTDDATHRTNGFKYPTLGKVMRAFKSVSAIAVNCALGRLAMPVWQRDYFERIVRPGREYERIRKYIVENPARWEEDGWDDMPKFEEME